ncbi:MAG: hypothetical protein CMN78_04240 [Spirochaetales bacterium]|nr:hypothetical protein [Spirochaetales bacterium]
MISDRRTRQDRFVRYYDDIEYGCESEEQAHSVLATFENSLREYELEINPDKVQIFSGPRDVESPRLYRLRDIQCQEGVRADSLVAVFSFVAELAVSSPRKPRKHERGF